MNTIIKQIKQELRAMMNGVASAAMRKAGLTADYRVNFGVELPRLKNLLDEIRTEMLPTLPMPEEGTNEARLAKYSLSNSPLRMLFHDSSIFTSMQGSLPKRPHLRKWARI